MKGKAAARQLRRPRHGRRARKGRFAAVARCTVERGGGSPCGSCSGGGTDAGRDKECGGPWRRTAEICGSRLLPPGPSSASTHGHKWRVLCAYVLEERCLLIAVLRTTSSSILPPPSCSN
ncbi:hypothetical protein ACP70R_016313 [Stipagrostis hirtigluma subsp. patula]